MSSFDDFYKKWKENNGVTSETAYQNLTDEQKAQRAMQNIDRTFEKLRASNNSSNNIWNQVKNIANSDRMKLQKANMENYIKNKTNILQNASNIIQETNKKQEEINKIRIKDINKKFSQQNKATVLPLGNEKQEEKAFPKVSLVKEKTGKLKELNSIDLYELTNGEIDTRSPGLQFLGDTKAVVGNALMGAEGVIPSTVNYMDSMMKQGLKTGLGEIASKVLQNDETGKVIGELAGEAIHSTSRFSKMNKELNSEELQEWRDSTIEKNKKLTSNPLANKLAEITPSVGQNALPMAVSVLNPVAGTALFITSSGGSYLEEGRKMGMTEKQALAYATGMAGIEGTSEAIISIGFIDNVLKKVGTKGISKEILNHTGINIGENFIQEFATEYIDEYTKSVVSLDEDTDIIEALSGKGEYANWENIHQRAFQSGLNGIISAVILDGASMGVVSAADVVSGKSKDITKAFNDSKKVVNMEEIKKGVGTALEKQINSDILNSQQQSTQTQQILPTQQITQQENKVAQNGNIEQRKMLPIQNYIYEKSDNVKIDNLRQDASKYWDNSEKTKNYITMLEKIIQDKDIDIRLDANLTDSKGNIANGSYSNGVITINPNSTRAGEFIAIHELTHAIGTEQMKNIVQKYRESNAEFDTAVKSLLQNYNTTELTEEAMADVSAQLFGNQEFINNLAQTEPSLFKKIYNEIKYLWHQFTGYKNQDQFINDLQYKWEQAYRNNNNLNNTTNYSIAGRKSLENIRDNKMLYDSGISSYDQAQQMANKNISNEQIRQQTGWFQDKNGDWKYEFSDKDMAIKNIRYEQNKNYKLGNILKHDTLFELYPELKQLTVKIDNTNKISGNYNKNSKTITLSNKLLNNSKRLEGTLIHEIQHAIQDIEGFEKGTTSKLSKERYYNSLGEIEADNTRKRFIDEKYNNKDITNEAPESSKTNPKHRGYDNYMNNRAILDKVKDSMFKYFKGLGGSNEIFQENNQKNIQQDIRLVDDGRNGRYVKKGGNSNEFSQENMEQVDETPLQDSNKEIWNRLENSKKGSFSMQDNQGRTLTKEQQEYFKDSKVRDENGNLKTMYHGTDAEFNEFTYENYGKTGTAYGKGFYFTDSKEAGQSYGKNLKEVYLNIKKPMEIGKTTMSKADFKRLVEVVNKQTDGIIEADYGSIEEAVMEYDYGGDDIDLINSLMSVSGLNTDRFYEILRNTLGYDGIKANNNSNGKDGNYYLAFNSNQIKNVDNTSPTTNSDIRYSLPTKEWQRHLEENYKSTGTRTNLKDIKLPTQETSKGVSINLPTNIDTKKVKFDNDNLIQESNKMSDEETAQILTEIKGRTNEKRKLSVFLKSNLIDKGMVFEELARKTNNRDLQGKYDYTLTAEARGQNAIGNARYDYQTTVEDGKIKKGNKNAKQISKSLTDIIDEVGENPTDFYNYMYHQLNIDRMTLEERFGGDTGVNYERKNTIKNKPVFGKEVTAEISRKYVEQLEQKHPEFKEFAQDVYDFLDANTKELVDNGVISKETQQLFKDMYPHYVPISRVTNKGQAINVPLDTGRTGVNSPIKRAKGGNRDINPLFQTMADRTLQTYRASARNNFGVELKNTLEKAKQLNQITELTDIDSIMESMTDEEQNNNLLQEGVNGENPTFTVFENGEKVTYEISKDMYDALKPKNELLKRFDNSKISKGLNKINNFRRGLLTEYNPVFSITNAIKDAQDVLLNSQHSAKTYSKIPEATAQILSKGYWYKEYMQNGGEQNSYFRDGEFDVTKKTLPTKTKEVVTLPLKAISSVNNVIEMTPRLAEYIVSRQQGRSIETSMLDASRVTTNFKAGGDITKTLNRNGFTFLNASVQGMQQQIRNIQEANAKGLKGYAVLATKYAIAGLPVLILNNLIWNDDEEYEELQDYVKDNYYIIGKSKDGTFIRIPKGRAVATIQKIVSNADEFIKKAKTTSILDIDELGNQFWNDLKEDISFAKDNLAPNNPFENWVGAPIKQALSNKTWYGEALVPTRLQDKPKEEQYDETTDEISKWIGKHLKVSPIKVNYLIDQYSGGVGDVLLPKLTPQAENTVLEDKFSTDPMMKNKYPGEFFEKIDELKINKNSEKATDEDKLKYQYMSSVQSEMNDLYKEKREIQNSKVTDEMKKKQLKQVQKKINDLAKNGLEKVDKVTKGTNYAQIDSNQYYKDIEGEWKKVSEDDKKKNKESGLSLKTYGSYKHESSKIKQQKVKSGEITKEQSLKSKDKIQILLNSEYSDKEKTAIYENYIKTQTKEGEYDSFDVIKASNIDIDEYLKYEQQEFSSDKKDDGTLDGKTVSKSKQKKVVSYLNSMNIEGNQRLLLYAMQGYTTNSSQKSQLAQYVYSLKLDKDTKLELYNKFSGFKVYKDGRVKW